MSANSRERWLFWLAAGFGAWNVVGAAAAVASGLLWRTRISPNSLPLAGFFIHGALYCAIGVLALVAAARMRTHGKKLWWAVLGVAAVDGVAGVLRRTASRDDWLDLGIVVAVALVSWGLARRAGMNAAVLRE